MNLNKGYSLIEILVVLSIFSLMSLLILSFTNISVNSSLLVSEETNKLRRLINTSEIIKDDLILSSAPGKHKITWDGRDRFGQLVASGIYYYQFNLGTNINSGKITYLK